MKEYTYTEARRELATLLDEALHDGEVIIKRRSGEVFSVRPKRDETINDPFAHVEPIKGKKISNEVICEAAREGRDRDYGLASPSTRDSD